MDQRDVRPAGTDSQNLICFAFEFKRRAHLFLGEFWTRGEQHNVCNEGCCLSASVRLSGRGKRGLL